MARHLTHHHQRDGIDRRGFLECMACPLWAVYPEWGWTTRDGEEATSLRRRFGHIHQTMQKVGGSVTFHTACSTAFPQPRPGAAAGPGPMKVPAEELRGGPTGANGPSGPLA